VNATFYRLPTEQAVARWVAETPAEFVLTIKVSRYLTHVKRLTDAGDGLARFYERIAPLVRSPKLGPLLWQLPPSFRRDDERLAATLERLPSGRHAFEFRHASWFADEVYELLRSHGAALVIGDAPDRDFQTHELTADFTLVRFHYGRAGDGDYGEDELEAWARRIDTWRGTVDVYAYFNNDWHGYAVENGRRLHERLGV
jgi:uncharacterized protein YecE (DUF72 family)